MTEGETACLEGQHQPHGRAVQRRAYAAHMREDEAALEVGDVGLCYPDPGELAESGVDAVDRRVAGGGLGDQRGRCVDPGTCGRVEL
jgi:hypothetical protein